MTGVGNTGVGGESGYTENLYNQNVTGSFNTWVGYQSGPSSPAQHDGVIGIGYRAKTSKDHQAVLGSPQIVETLLFGNVGINAVDPVATLVVNGTAAQFDRRLGRLFRRALEDRRGGVRRRPRRRQDDSLPSRSATTARKGSRRSSVRSGLIAQQVEQVAPYMISTEPGAEVDDVRVMSTQALPYLLVNAVQELEAKVAELERRLAEAEARSARP